MSNQTQNNPIYIQSSMVSQYMRKYGDEENAVYHILKDLNFKDVIRPDNVTIDLRTEVRNNKRVYIHTIEDVEMEWLEDGAYAGKREDFIAFIGYEFEDEILAALAYAFAKHYGLKKVYVASPYQVPFTLFFKRPPVKYSGRPIGFTGRGAGVLIQIPNDYDFLYIFSEDD